MITVFGGAGDRLSVFVSEDEPTEVQLVVGALLGAKVNKKNPHTYSIPVHDFPLLRDRLNRLGRTEGRDMDERAEGIIRDYEQLMGVNARIKRGDLNGDIEPYLPQVLKSTLWVDQVADTRFCLRHAKAGVFSEMGTGKTAVVLAAFALLKLAKLARYALVVCPNSVKANWLRQVGEHTHLSAVELGNGTGELKRNLARYVRDRADVCVTHYDAMRSDEFRTRLCRVPFDVVVCDETHAIKNLSAERSTAMLDALSRIRASLDLIEAEVELEDGTMMKALLPHGAKPGDEVVFW